MTRPRSRVRLSSVVLAGIASLLILPPGGPSTPVAGAQAPAPVQTPAPAHTAPAPDQTVAVGVTDPAGALSPEDEDLLRAETPRLGLPGQVRRVEYLVFDDGGDNLNDTTERFAQEQRPDLVSRDRTKWAPGTLIVANDQESRKVGLYCGDDVCTALDIFEGRHLDGSLEAMKDPMRRGNTAAGLLAGARAAADPTVLAPGSEGTPGWVPWAVGGVAVAGLGAAGAAVVTSRRKKAATAREQYDRVSREYGRISGELDGLDIRANSLSSPLADGALRRQWGEVRDGFLALDSVMDRIGDLRPESPDADFRRHAADIGTAHTTVDRMITAEKNIDELFRMEQGDAQVRRRQLGELREDMLKASLATRSDRLAEQTRELCARADELSRDPGVADFMDRYAGLVSDYTVVVQAIRDRELGTVQGAENTHRNAPSVYESDWRAGYGYTGYVPFVMVSSWHDEDVRAAESASSATNTGYSSSSFSGGGGSSGY